MIRNYLFISKNFTGGGLETRIREQIAVFKKHDIRCYLITSKYNHKFDNLFDGVYLDIDFYLEEKCIKTRLKLMVEKIIQYCKINKIDFIDCHPFDSLLPSVIAANRMGLPISYTIHGKASLYYPNNNQEKIKLLNDISILYGVDLINIVAESLNDNLYDYNKINLLENGIIICDKNKYIFPFSRKWALVSRLDKQKAEIIINSLEYLDNEIFDEIEIIGDGEFTEELNEILSESNYSTKIKVVGWVDDVKKYLLNNCFDGVIGMGRAVLEAMSLNIPSIMLGYGGIAGLINKNNYDLFSNFNFTYYSRISKRDFIEELNALYKSPESYELRKLVKKYNNSLILWEKYLEKIDTIKPLPKKKIDNMIKVLMSIDSISELELFNAIFKNDLEARLKYTSYMNRRQNNT